MSRVDSKSGSTDDTPKRSNGDGRVETVYWSFGSGKTQAILPATPLPVVEDNPRSANSEPDATSGLEGPLPVPPRPVEPPRMRLGKRALRPLAQWEGVVESVERAGFRARVVPMANGKPAETEPEFTEFDFDDLAHPSERDLVKEGALFYWTIGRARNEAGTVTNTSLVRFRRVPPPSTYQAAHAEEEAAEILRFAEQEL